MTKRLVEIYRPGEIVDVDLPVSGWQPATVARLAHPGVWVATGDGRLWFVTNGRRIRTTRPGARGAEQADA